jgi:hypothetical protein
MITETRGATGLGPLPFSLAISSSQRYIAALYSTMLQISSSHMVVGTYEGNREQNLLFLGIHLWMGQVADSITINPDTEPA